MNNNSKLCLVQYIKLNIVSYTKFALAIIVYEHKICSIIEYNVKINNNKTNDRSELIKYNDIEIEIDSEIDSKVSDLRKPVVEGEFQKLTIDFIGIKFGTKLVGFFSLNIAKGLLKFNPNLLDDVDVKLGLQGVIQSVELTQNCLSVIIEQGFLNNHDLSNYPIMCDLIEYFTQNKDYIKGEFSHESFKWLYNLIQLSMYSSLIEYENIILENKFNNQAFKDNLDLEPDVYHDLVLKRKEIYQKLDPSIRKSLQKHGITLIQNLETGFDTEYVNKDLLSNKLISVQIAQHLQCYLKLPLPSRYKLCKLNPVTEAKYPIKITKSFDFTLVETIIANHVERIRLILYGNNDICMSTLIDTMLADPKLKCFENQDNVIIRLPKSSEKVLIKLIGSEGYTLNKLLTDSTRLSIDDIYKYRSEVITKMKDALIHYDKLLENSVNLKKKVNLGIEVIETEGNILHNFGEIFNQIKESKSVICHKESINEEVNEVNNDVDNLIEKSFNLKALSRKSLTITRNNRISINYVFNNVIIGHNTPADLSILNDFEEFKNELDIVNKGFITLGKGFRYSGYNVVVRDTMLLAPAGQKSLASIGKLYNYEKINLTEYEITHMDILLKENPSKFYEYAMRDPLITLKHAS